MERWIALRIGVRLCNWIGDVIMAMPALEALREHHPNDEIVGLARPWVQEIFHFRPDLLDRMLCFEDRKAFKNLGSFRSWVGDLRAERFDRVLVFTKHFRGAVAAWLSGAPERWGFSTAETWLFLNRKFPRRQLPRTGRHQSRDYLDLMSALNMPAKTALWPRLNRDTALEERCLADVVAGGPKPLLAVHAGAAYGTAKRWLVDGYAKLCRRFVEEFEGAVILLGVEAEAETNDVIAGVLPKQRVFNLSGKTGLKESIALIAACDLFVSNDSGLMHVAAAFEKPQVAVFGPTDVTATFPANPHAETVTSPEACDARCGRHCAVDHRCMKAVSADDVWAALQKVMAGKSRGGEA